MKTIIVSDTHGNINRIIDVVSKDNEIERIIHLGDFARDATDLEIIFQNLSVISVKGNNDYFDKLQHEIVLDLYGKTVFLTHGHTYGVKTSTIRLVERAKEVGASITFFGHTHIKCCENILGITLLNPSANGYIIFGDDGSIELFDL